MNKNSKEYSGERAFLHEICNALAVSHGLLHLILMKARKDSSELKLEEVIARVEKALTSVEKINRLVVDRRAALTQDSEQAKPM